VRGRGRGAASRPSASPDADADAIAGIAAERATAQNDLSAAASPSGARLPGVHRSDGRIGRRLFVHIGGFDPETPERVHARLVRELARFRRTWSTLTWTSAPRYDADGAAWTVETTGRDWHVSTLVRFVRWDDVMADYARRPLWLRTARGAVAGLDFAAGGALKGYLRTNWRYALFFLYPLVVVAALLAAAVYAGAAVAALTGWTAAGALVAVVGLGLLIYGPVRWLHLPLASDDWTFARDYIRHPPPTLIDRLDRLAAEIVAAARTGEVDEVVVLGHSLGAVLAVDVVERALRLDPELGRGGSPVALVTVGSSILKIALHRGAVRLRAALSRVAAAPAPFWVEYQALVDIMNFYKTDPIAEAGLPPSGRPLVRVVRISKMLDPDYYRRIKGRFFRLHCQFVSGNDRRAAYDYFVLACGPVAVRELACLPEGPASAFAADGSLIDRGAPSAATCATGASSTMMSA